MPILRLRVRMLGVESLQHASSDLIYPLFIDSSSLGVSSVAEAGKEKAGA